MEQITPIRHEWIKKYLKKYKNNAEKSRMIIEAAEESEEYTKLILEPEKYVHFLDTMPELKAHIEEVQKKEQERLNKKIVEEEEEKDQVFVLGSAIK